MNILLINNNPIVSKLFALSAKSIINVHIDEIDSSGLIPKSSYDLLFIDDGCCGYHQIEEFFGMINATKKILFGNKKSHTIEYVDAVIIKPFLPSQIIEMLQTVEGSQENIQENIIDEIESLRRNKEERDESNPTIQKSMILDSDEIDTIKKLLLDEEELVDDKSEVEKTLVDKERSHKYNIESIVDALQHIESQKIREILAGAEIKIKIKFPKEV